MNPVEHLAYQVNQGYLTSTEFQDEWSRLDELEKETFLNVMKQHRKSVVWFYGYMFLSLLFCKDVRFIFL